MLFTWSGRDESFTKVVLDAYPAPTFIVDDDVCISHFNEAGKGLLGPRPRTALRRRGGEALHCVHARETPGGCGHAEVCRTCVLRNAVGEAFTGQRVLRRKARLEVETAGGLKELFFLVTAAPFTYHRGKFCLLIAEAINDLISLQRLVPVCAWCRKIRNDQEYWHDLEHYLKTEFEADVTHGICPECRDRMLAEHAAQAGTD